MGNTRTSNIFFGVVLVLAFSFAAMKFALPILVALLVLVGVARLSWRRPPFALVMMGVLYLMYVIGLLGSEDVQASAKFLEYKASLLVFPLLFALAPRHSANGELRVMLSFTLGCLVFDLFALGNGLADAIETDNWGELGYKKLAIIFHPTYLSIYNAFAWSWCMLKFNELKGWVRQIGIVFALLSPLMIGLLASRAGILAFGVLAVYFFIRAVWKRGAFSTRMWFLSVAIFGVSLAFPATVQRVESVMDRGEDVGSTEKKSSSQVRLVTWKNAVTLMRQYPQGVGTGDVTNELVRLYDEQGELTASEKKLNAHNQYLQTGVELGWLGLLVLLSTMVPLALYAMRKRWELALIFLFLIAFNMLFESFLELQMGIMFYCFFLSFFTWQSLQKDELV